MTNESWGRRLPWRHPPPPPLFFMQCGEELASLSAFLLNRCLNHNYFIPVWPQAFITPFFKKGENTTSNSYRPIDLTCTLCETVIKDQLLDFLLNKNLIPRHQHGFMRNHSTTTNLLERTHDWVVDLTNHNNIDVVYIGFSKAFDSIVFSKLNAKLEQCDIAGH